MIVTSIKQQKNNKNKYSVFIDYKYCFSLYINDIKYFKIEMGSEISYETYEYIKETLLYIEAQNVALKFLSYKMRTENEIYRKLCESNYENELIEKVINFLHKYKYIDDEKYCHMYIDECKRLKPKGKYLIKYELKQKGIDENIINDIVDNEDIDEVSDAVKILDKKIKNIDYIDIKQKNKIFSMLQRKGYSYDTIKEALEISISKLL